MKKSRLETQHRVIEFLSKIAHTSDLLMCGMPDIFNVELKDSERDGAQGN